MSTSRCTASNFFSATLLNWLLNFTSFRAGMPGISMPGGTARKLVKARPGLRSDGPGAV